MPLALHEDVEVAHPRPVGNDTDVGQVEPKRRCSQRPDRLRYQRAVWIVGVGDDEDVHDAAHGAYPLLSPRTLVSGGGGSGGGAGPGREGVSPRTSVTRSAAD